MLCTRINEICTSKGDGYEYAASDENENKTLNIPALASARQY